MHTTNSAGSRFDVRGFLSRHLADVFSTMLSFDAVPLGDTEAPHHADRVTGSVGLGGDSIHGILYLHLSDGLARAMAGAMLGMPAEEVTAEADVNDVIGEVTNMLTGGLKSALCDAGYPCAVSTPCIIRGSSFVIETVPELERMCLVFECQGERGVIEVNIQFS